MKKLAFTATFIAYVSDDDPRSSSELPGDVIAAMLSAASQARLVSLDTTDEYETPQDEVLEAVGFDSTVLNMTDDGN